MLAVVVGLALLGVCLSQWSDGTGSTMTRALTDYNRGDRGDLASFGFGQLSQTSKIAVEGLAGLFWLGIGVFLLKTTGSRTTKNGFTRRVPPPRR